MQLGQPGILNWRSRLHIALRRQRLRRRENAVSHPTSQGAAWSVGGANSGTAPLLRRIASVGGRAAIQLIAVVSVKSKNQSRSKILAPG